MKVMAGLCSYVTFIWESPFLFEFGYIDLSQQTDKLLFETLIFVVIARSEATWQSPG